MCSIAVLQWHLASPNPLPLINTTLQGLYYATGIGLNARADMP